MRNQSAADSATRAYVGDGMGHPIAKPVLAPQVASSRQIQEHTARSSRVVGWNEALARSGHNSLYESMVMELAEYLGEAPATVAAACEAGAESVAQEWKARQLGKESPPAEVVEFYRTTKSYLFDLTTFNAEYPHIATLEALVAMAKGRGLKQVLDFGSGIGSVGLFFALNGMEVALADVSEPLQDYLALAIQGTAGLKVEARLIRTRNLAATRLRSGHGFRCTRAFAASCGYSSHASGNHQGRRLAGTQRRGTGPEFSAAYRDLRGSIAEGRRYRLQPIAFSWQDRSVRTHRPWSAFQSSSFGLGQSLVRILLPQVDHAVGSYGH